MFGAFIVLLEVALVTCSEVGTAFENCSDHVSVTDCLGEAWVLLAGLRSFPDAGDASKAPRGTATPAGDGALSGKSTLML